MEWISVKDRMPDWLVEVLIVIKYQKIPVQAYWNGKVWRGSMEVTDAVNDGYVKNRDITGCEITHWMPLPEPPQCD